ncbi:hypothetical protein PanWU01x14_072290, partial [Parasponia andersonii]
MYVIIDMENEGTDDVYQFTLSQSSQELLEHPPASYAPWIEPKVWDEFVKKIVSAEWEKVRKVQQGKATQNKYPHRISRLGYAGLEAKIEKDKGRCGIDRSELRSRGRVPKKGDHTEEIKVIVYRIKDYNQQFQERNLEIDGSNNILTMALGTPEYSGR